MSCRIILEYWLKQKSTQPHTLYMQLLRYFAFEKRKDRYWTYVLVCLDAALGKSQPESRTDVVERNRLDETIEASCRTTAVQQLNAHVVEQLVMATHTQCLQLPTRQLLACNEIPFDIR